MLTIAQEDLIAATAPVVAEHLNTITARFYPLMFERYPEVKPLFNQTHQSSGGQARALAGAVLAYVGARHSREAVDRLLAPVISKHVSLNILPEHYPIVGECLMAAIGEVLGDAVTPEIADAWGALYGELADVLIAAEQGRYDSFAATRGGWQGLRRFRIARLHDESSEIRSLYLEPLEGPLFSFTPGQYIGMRLVTPNGAIHRHYSLSHTPNDAFCRISVKREPHGQSSNYLHSLTVGDEIDLLPPGGELTLGDYQGPVLLLSAGVGQTPMLPLLDAALAAGRQIIYLHAARNPDVHAFDASLTALAARHPDQLHYQVCYEQADTLPRHAHLGVIERDWLARQLVDNNVSAEALEAFVIGPHGFMQAMIKTLTTLGVPVSHCHYEHFGPSITITAEPAIA
ncbi:globin domain-containing protein [Cobetia crustatorum]|uniref:globin domain-containing protein n=1 Tax=Cobetia crustatorum TaxID=553385 RepID=UPI0004699DCB|nr:globin domain-containing protein [Cobetia crustatorum]